jgi:hypothetical protein
MEDQTTAGVNLTTTLPTSTICQAVFSAKKKAASLERGAKKPKLNRGNNPWLSFSLGEQPSKHFPRMV